VYQTETTGSLVFLLANNNAQAQIIGPNLKGNKMYSTTIDYLGKKFEVDYEITQDHNGDDEFQVESIVYAGEEWMDFLECVHLSNEDSGGWDSAVEQISSMVIHAHQEPEAEYDSMTMEDE